MDRTTFPYVMDPDSLAEELIRGAPANARGLKRADPSWWPESRIGSRRPDRLDQVNRSELEYLRDLPGKVIKGDIKFVRRDQLRPALAAESIVIENTGGYDLKLQINYNPESNSKGFNVSVTGIGAICRLDVDGQVHGDAGRSHKHSLQKETCPSTLPREVVPRPELSGQSLKDLFQVFCSMANIHHEGHFFDPSE